MFEHCTQDTTSSVSYCAAFILFSFFCADFILFSVLLTCLVVTLPPGGTEKKRERLNCIYEAHIVELVIRLFHTHV